MSNNILDIIKDDINILLIGEMSSGKTTLISCMLNELVGTIKRTRGTNDIMIYSSGIKKDNISNISNYVNKDYIFNKVDNCDIKVPNMRVNLIDTIGLNDFSNDVFMRKEIEKIRPYIDLVIYLIDCNTGLDKASDNDIKKLVETFDNIVCVINKYDDLEDLELFDIVKQIIGKLGQNKSIVSLSADSILTCKSIIHGFSDKIKKNKITIFESLYGKLTHDKMLEQLKYNTLLDMICTKIDITKIINNKIKINLEYTTKITDLITYIQYINNTFCNIISYDMFYNYVEHICKKYNTPSDTLNLFSDLSDKISYIKENNIVSEYICDKLLSCIEQPNNMATKAIYELGKLSIIPVILASTTHYLLNYNTDIFSHYNMIYKFILSLIYYNDNKNLLNTIYIDKLIFKLLLYEHQMFNYTYIIANHITKYYDKYVIKLPTAINLRFITPVCEEYLIIPIDTYKTPTILLIEDILQISSIKSGIITKQHFIYKLLENKFVIFPIKYLHSIQNSNQNNSKQNCNSDEIQLIATQTYMISEEYIEDNFMSSNTIDTNYIKFCNNLKYLNITQNVDCNIGLLTGDINKIFVISVTYKNNGFKHWNNLLTKYNGTKDIDTLIITASNGDKQYCFTNNNTQKYFTKSFIFSEDTEKIGIHVKNNNSFVLAPYSTDVDGNKYTFNKFNHELVNNNKYISDKSIDNIRQYIKDMPQWLCDKLDEYYSYLEKNKSPYFIEDEYEKKLFVNLTKEYINPDSFNTTLDNQV